MMAAEPAGRILVVEDDPTVAEVVTRYLQRENFDVETAADGVSALARALGNRPDLVVLDLMLPGLDGLEICRRLRADGDTPIVVLTAKGDADDRIAGLELGADDYITKPFSSRELVARVHAVLRRARAAPVAAAGPLVSGPFSLDERARVALANGQQVTLTVREFDLLAHLMRHPGRVFGRQALLEEVWGYRFGDTSTVTVHMHRLREKVERDPSAPRHLVTVWGVGYRFDP